MLECWFEFMLSSSQIKVFVEYTKTAGHGEDSYEREFDLRWDSRTNSIQGAWNGQLIGGETGEVRVRNDRNEEIELRFITKRAKKVKNTT